MQVSPNRNPTQLSQSSRQSSPNDKEELPHERRAKKKKGNACALVINLSECKYVVVRQVARELRFKVGRQAVGVGEWDLTWTDGIVAPQTLARMRPHQKINHFPGMYNLSRKNYLARNIIKMHKQFPSDYHFHPHTWTLPAQYNDLRLYLQAEPNPVVIAKPEAGCQGRGIFLAKDIEDFTFGQHYVVQKYVKKPFLLQGLKFDLRVYVLVAGCDPLRVYIYRQGLARFATEPYVSPKRQNLSNLFMHLTNYAINKSSAKFEFNQSTERMDVGHKRSLSAVLRKIAELGFDSELIWSQICQIITKTMISVQPVLAHNYRSCQPDNLQNNMCFQVLGFDIMLDSELRPVLLEVNYTPSFTTDTPLDQQIKQNLLRDTLVLMNLSNRAKHDALNTKKREMMERTLTGKKIWHSKQEREGILSKINSKRDAWQLKHLGNYQRAYPPPKTQIQTAQQYASFLAYSQACYLNFTGGNIKRNAKVSLPSTTTNDCIETIKTPLKYTNADQLERIYMKKPKPMVFQQKIKSNDSHVKEQIKQYQKEQFTEGRMLPDKQPIKELGNAKAYDSVQKIIAGKYQGNRVYTGYKISPKQVSKRGSSAMNGNALSRIYNIAFREMKPIQ